MNIQKNIALVAHDNRKKDVIEWMERMHYFFSLQRLSSRPWPAG